MMNLLDQSTDIFDLGCIRNTLVRLEDTIIFALIERAQFAHNPRIYQKDGFREVLHRDGFEGSWLDWFIKETESMHGKDAHVQVSFVVVLTGTAAKVRRYESPDEVPFTPRHLLPQPILPPLQYPKSLYPNSINVNDRIQRFYLEHIVPSITKRTTPSGQEDDDQNYGSSATIDVEALQAISRRVHYGKFVSESKFLSRPADFVPHILNPNPQALLDLITKPQVEEALLVRLAYKALTYGQDLDPAGSMTKKADPSTMKIDVDEVVKLYRDYIIPLTKDVEVEYLLKRLDGLSVEEIGKLSNE